MIRRICIIALFTLTCIMNASAEEKEKVVTNKWSMVFGNAAVADHYLTNQEHTGILMGIQGEHGAFYKRSNNLSWDLDISFVSSPYSEYMEGMSLSNPAGTSFYGLYNFNTEYGTYYNWNPIKNLYLKAGGVFDLMAGFNRAKPNSINNIIDVDFQTQIKAAAGIKYGWNFEKCGLFLHSEFAIPFMGLALSGSRYQSSLATLVGGELLPGNISPIHFTSFHNLQGYNMELGIELVLKSLTLFLEYEDNFRWWTIYDIQNYRKFSFIRIGLGVDLVSRSRHKSNNRQF